MTENIQQNLSSTDDNYNTEYNKYFILKKGRDEFPDEWNKVIKMFPENKESVERTFYNFYKNELINRDQSFDIIPDYDDYGQSITISRSQIEKDKKLSQELANTTIPSTDKINSIMSDPKVFTPYYKPIIDAFVQDDVDRYGYYNSSIAAGIWHLSNSDAPLHLDNWHPDFQDQMGAMIFSFMDPITLLTTFGTGGLTSSGLKGTAKLLGPKNNQYTRAAWGMRRDYTESMFNSFKDRFKFFNNKKTWRADYDDYLNYAQKRFEFNSGEFGAGFGFTVPQLYMADLLEQKAEFPDKPFDHWRAIKKSVAGGTISGLQFASVAKIGGRGPKFSTSTLPNDAGFLGNVTSRPSFQSTVANIKESPYFKYPAEGFTWTTFNNIQRYYEDSDLYNKEVKEKGIARFYVGNLIQDATVYGMMRGQRWAWNKLTPYFKTINFNSKKNAKQNFNDQNKALVQANKTISNVTNVTGTKNISIPDDFRDEFLEKMLVESNWAAFINLDNTQLKGLSNPYDIKFVSTVSDMINSGNHDKIVDILDYYRKNRIRLAEDLGLEVILKDNGTSEINIVDDGKFTSIVTQNIKETLKANNPKLDIDSYPIDSKIIKTEKEAVISALLSFDGIAAKIDKFALTNDKQVLQGETVNPYVEKIRYTSLLAKLTDLKASETFNITKSQREIAKKVNQDFIDNKITQEQAIQSLETINSLVTQSVDGSAVQGFTYMKDTEQGAIYFKDLEKTVETIDDIVGKLQQGTISSLIKNNQLSADLKNVAKFLQKNGPTSTNPVQGANDLIKEQNTAIIARAVYEKGNIQNVDKFVNMLNSTSHKDITKVTEDDIIKYAKTQTDMTGLKSPNTSLTAVLAKLQIRSLKLGDKYVYRPLDIDFDIKSQKLQDAYTALQKKELKKQEKSKEEILKIKIGGQDLIIGTASYIKQNPYNKIKAPIERVVGQKDGKDITKTIPVQVSKAENLMLRLGGGIESIGIRDREISKITPAHIEKSGNFYNINLSFGVDEIQKKTGAATNERRVDISKELYNDLQSYIKEYNIKKNQVLFDNTQIPPQLIQFLKIITKGANVKGKPANIQWIRQHTANKLLEVQQTILNPNQSIPSVQGGQQYGVVKSFLFDFINATIGHDTSTSALKKASYGNYNLYTVLQKPELALPIQKELRTYLSKTNPIGRDFNKVIKTAWKVLFPNDKLSGYKELATWLKTQQDFQIKIDPGMLGMSIIAPASIRVSGAKDALDRMFNRVGRLFGSKAKNNEIIQDIQSNFDEWVLAGTEVLRNLGDLTGKDILKEFTNEFAKYQSNLKHKDFEDILKDIYLESNKRLQNTLDHNKHIIKSTRSKFFSIARKMGIGNKTAQDKVRREELVSEMAVFAGINDPIGFAKDGLSNNALLNRPIQDIIKFKAALNSFDKTVSKSKNTTKWEDISQINALKNELEINDSDFDKLLNVYRIPGLNLNNASKSQILKLKSYLLSERQEFISDPFSESMLRDLEKLNLIPNEKIIIYKNLKNTARNILMTVDIIRGLGAKEIAGLLAKQQSRLATLRYQLQQLEDDMATSLSSYQIVVDVDNNIMEWRPGNKKDGKKLWNKYKDAMTDLKDVEHAKRLMTAESKTKPGELFIDVYFPKKYSKLLKELRDKIYDTDWNLRTDTVEGYAMQTYDNWFKQWPEHLQSASSKVLPNKKWLKWVKLFGPKGEKWLNNYGPLRISDEFRRANQSTSNTLLPKDTFESIQLKLAVEALEVQKLKIPRKIEEIKDLAKTTFVDDDGVSQSIWDLAHELTVKEGKALFQPIRKTEISATPMKWRAKDRLDVSYVYDAPLIVRTTNRVPKEFSTWKIGEGSFDNNTGGYCNSMSNLVSILEFFPSLVTIDGVQKANPAKIIKNELSRLGKNSQVLTKESQDFIYAQLANVFGISEFNIGPGINQVVNAIDRGMGFGASIIAKAFLSIPLKPALINLGTGQAKGVLFWGPYNLASSYLKIRDAAYRDQWKRLGGTQVGLSIYEEFQLPFKTGQKFLDAGFRIGGTRDAELFNRFTADLQTMGAFDSICTVLKESVPHNLALNPSNGVILVNNKPIGTIDKLDGKLEDLLDLKNKLGAKIGHGYNTALTYCRDVFGLSDEEIALFMLYGFKPHGVFHLPTTKAQDTAILIKEIPELGKMSPKLRQKFVDMYLDAMLQIRHLGSARTQGSILPGFQSPFLRQIITRNLLLFQKLGISTDVDAARLFWLTKRKGALVSGFRGILFLLSTLGLGALATEFVAAISGKPALHEDSEPIKTPLGDFNYRQFLEYLRAGQAFSILGDLYDHYSGERSFTFAVIDWLGTIRTTVGSLIDKTVWPEQMIGVEYGDIAKEFGTETVSLVRALTNYEVLTQNPTIENHNRFKNSLKEYAKSHPTLMFKPSYEVTRPSALTKILKPSYWGVDAPELKHLKRKFNKMFWELNVQDKPNWYNTWKKDNDIKALSRILWTIHGVTSEVASLGINEDVGGLFDYIGEDAVHDLMSPSTIYGIKDAGIYYLKDKSGNELIFPNKYGAPTRIVGHNFKDKDGNHIINEEIKQRYEDAGKMDIYYKAGYDKIDFGKIAYEQRLQAATRSQGLDQAGSLIFNFYSDLINRGDEKAAKEFRDDWKEYQNRVDFFWALLQEPYVSPIGVKHLKIDGQKYAWDSHESIKSEKDFQYNVDVTTHNWGDINKNPLLKDFWKRVVVRRLHKIAKKKGKTEGYNSEDLIRDANKALKVINQKTIQK